MRPRPAAICAATGHPEQWGCLGELAPSGALPGRRAGAEVRWVTLLERVGRVLDGAVPSRAEGPEKGTWGHRRQTGSPARVQEGRFLDVIFRDALQPGAGFLGWIKGTGQQSGNPGAGR